MIVTVQCVQPWDRSVVEHWTRAEEAKTWQGGAACNCHGELTVWRCLLAACFVSGRHKGTNVSSIGSPVDEESMRTVGEFSIIGVTALTFLPCFVDVTLGLKTSNFLVVLIAAIFYFFYFFFYLLPSRILDPLRFQAGGRRRRPNLGLVFFVDVRCIFS